MDTLSRLFSFLSELIFPLRDTGELVRDLTPVVFGRLVAPTITSQGYTGLLPYRHRIVRAVIIEAKFRRNKKAIKLLSGVLADYMHALSDDGSAFEKKEFVILPIPLSSERLRERGYNQVEEVVKEADLQYDTVRLLRIRNTVPQTSLTKRERQQNMMNAFTAVGPFQPNTTYVVLDDVTTTGTTLHCAVQALEAKGIQAIPLALAY